MSGKSSVHHGSIGAASLPSVLEQSRVRVVFGEGKLRDLGAIAKAEGASNVMLVSDPGIVQAGHVERATESLRDADISVTVFDGVEVNPTTEHVQAGVEVARRNGIDFLVGLGGGSSLDCAKGINFILSNGGEMADYWGVNKATKPMLPSIGVPTTAGTGSEAQSFALICDPVTHQKMACGDEKAAFRVAILDPDLTLTQPSYVAATAGIDAVAHTIETVATNKRNEISLEFSRQAWQRLAPAFHDAMTNPANDEARAAMLMGAHLAGAAIEHSMLGAAHACANPLTARYGIVHGDAVGVLLPAVIRFNAGNGTNPYGDLCSDPEKLADRVEKMLETSRLARRLTDLKVPASDLPQLAKEAEKQWTAGFNPRPVVAKDLLDIYQAAYA